MFSSCQRYICKLCFSNIEETDVQNIDVNIQEMLDALLSGIDLPASENPVICKTCHRRSEENYSFKKKCIFIEDSIKPFIVENIKVNFNEIRHQIIKSEDVETEKNVCRLCLQLIENDMVLTDTEKVQFKQFFPEINLDLTICAVVCLECYNKLQEYCIFVTSCKELNRQLSSYSVNNTEQDSNIKLENVHQLSSKMEDDEEHMATLLNHESDIKCEGDLIEIEEPSCSMEYSMEKRNGIKQECFQESLTNIEDDETKFKLLSEELDIKCEDDLPKEKWAYSNAITTNTSFKLRADNIQIENHGLSYKSLEDAKSNPIVTGHTDLFKIRVYKCEKCDYKSKRKVALKTHSLLQHTTPSKIDIQQFHEGELQEKPKQNDSSETKMYRCDKCDYKTKWPACFKNHVLEKHTENYKIKMYKCDKCDYESKWLICFERHVFDKHTDQFGESGQQNLNNRNDSNKIKIYRCGHCNYKSRETENLKSHIVLQHTNPSKVQMHKCQECDYESKWFACLKNHILFHHTDISKVQMYTCEKCDYRTKHKSCLKSHILTRHTDSSKIKMYKCIQCDYKSRWLKVIKKHVLNKHSDLFKIDK